jgi:uncharacterized Ntn-hydrolase superfamily protein
VTYSIVARDAETGDVGVAVQSRSFNAGAVVPWVEPGVGAVATQSYTEPAYGPLGLELLRAGKTPEQALAGLVAADPEPRYRQVAMLDAEGRTAVHVGEACIPAAGYVTGDGFSAQANLVASARVWTAMGEAFEAATGSLARRLLVALDAAEAAGGDWRGRQAGGIVVAPATGRPWERVIDIRVDDHDDPLGELRRLLGLREAYLELRESSEPVAVAEAAGMGELDVTWARITAALRSGEFDRARAEFRPLFEAEPRWADYVRSLGDRELLPHADELLSARR